MEIRTDIKNDEVLRGSFFDLAKRVFDLDLKTWYENGFWQDDYLPYSVVEDGKVVANVSVNVCNFRWRSRIRHLAQIGTVMTDVNYRGRGYIRTVMEKVRKDCDHSFEGMYLYSNIDKREFYEKLGFSRRYEYRCSKEVNITTESNVEKILMNSKDEWDRMVNIIQRRDQYGDHIMMGNSGLFMFYLAGPMSGSVYYSPSSEAYVVADVDNGTLKLYAIFSAEKVSLGDVIASFGKEIKKVILAFTPENNTGFDQKKIEDEDQVMFVRGEVFEAFPNEKFMFPEISHA